MQRDVLRAPFLHCEGREDYVSEYVSLSSRTRYLKKRVSLDRAEGYPVFDRCGRRERR